MLLFDLHKLSFSNVYLEIGYGGRKQTMNIIIKELQQEFFMKTAHMITELINYHRELNKSPKEYWSTDKDSIESLTEWCKEGAVYNLFEEKTLVGFFFIKFGVNNSGWLEDLYIIDKYRRKGIGKYAISKLDELMIEKGVKSLFIDVIPRNTCAIKFYSKCGFDHLNLIQLRKNYDKRLDKDEEVEILGYNFKEY